MMGEADGGEGYGTVVTEIYEIRVVDVTSKGADGFNGAENAAYQLEDKPISNLLFFF